MENYSYFIMSDVFVDLDIRIFIDDSFFGIFTFLLCQRVRNSDKNVENTEKKSRNYSQGVNSLFLLLMTVWSCAESGKIIVCQRKYIWLNPYSLIPIILPGKHNLNDSQQVIRGGGKLITGCFFKSCFF